MGRAMMLTNKNQIYDGLFKEGIIFSGTIYNEDGKVLSSGMYDNKGRIISGYDYVETRGGGYIILIGLQYDENGNRLYNGLVKVREKDPVKGRIILEANFINGKKMDW